VGLLLAVAAIAYGNTLWNGFAGDDDFYILHNPHVTDLSLRELFQANQASNVFRPLTFATFAVNWAASEHHAASYHIINLLLHAGVTWLLYLLLCALLEPWPGATTIALAGALLFAVHPIHTEAVAGIVGRSELLAAGFIFAAWLLHLKNRPVPALICFALALLSKESAVVFLPLVIVTDYAGGKWKSIARYAGIAGVTAIYLAVLWKAQGGRFGDPHVTFLDNPLAYLSAPWRILNAIHIAWKYVTLLFYPGTLSSDYSYAAITVYTSWRHLLLPSIAALCVASIWIWALLTRHAAWALAGSIFFIGFGVTANILTATGTIMGERLAYLPSAGFCLLIALLWAKLEKQNRNIAWVLLAGVILLLTIRTVIRNFNWRNDFSLSVSAVAAEPNNAKAHANLAVAEIEQGRLDDARQELQTSLSIYPDNVDAIESFGILDSRLGQTSEARGLFEKAFAMSSEEDFNYAFRAVNLAGVLLKNGENERSLRLLDHAIAIQPAFARAWAVRAVLHYKAGDLLAALSDAQAALRLDPENKEFQGLVSTFSAKVH
jgi:tetratricopeptide (TPR) repeat protein